MIQDFMNYSIQNARKIAVVFLRDGRMRKRNLTVCAVDAQKGTFLAVPAGKKKAEAFFLSDVLTCDYARGDHGELE